MPRAYLPTWMEHKKPTSEKLLFWVADISLLTKNFQEAEDRAFLISMAHPGVPVGIKSGGAGLYEELEEFFYVSGMKHSILEHPYGRLYVLAEKEVLVGGTFNS